jgi:peptidoglycan hydrolase-like protein with peptidoglycan-binding domain
MLLKLGTEGIEVANFQRFLISQGYKTVEADGDFGPKTDHATKQWQLSVGLTADGIVGPDSLSKAQAAKVDVGSQKPVKIELNVNRLSAVHPSLIEKAIKLHDLAVDEGFSLTITQGLRTFAEQDKLFAQGRTAPGQKVTNARSGQSMHNYGLAIDIAFYVDGKISWDEKLYKNIGRWAEVVGLEWGGLWRFRDLPHVQLKNLPSYKVLLPIYNTGGLKAVWEKYKG